MIHRIIEWSLRNRFFVLCGTLFLVAFGIRALRSTPVDAIPDLSENQVLVYADWSGRSPQEVEDQVTYPLSVNLQGLAGVRAVRANSMFGFSLVTIIFEDRLDNYFARQRVSERLSLIAPQMPLGVVPQLGPDATGLGWVYQYYLHVEPGALGGGSNTPPNGYSLGQLRSLQDFFVRQQLVAVSGVAEVASVGGFVQQYQIEVDPTRLRTAGVLLSEVLDAVGRENRNVGGKVIEENGLEFVVRGIALIRDASDLENIVLAERNGTPVHLRDVASVEIGGDFRRGALDVDGHEVVGGIVVMRTGENAMRVIQAVKERIQQIQHSLPPGVSVRPFYDRSELIQRTIDTLRHALVEEMLLVTLAHILFLFHFRSILIVTIPLPVSILIAFVLMEGFGVSSNIMSLAGIAIAIGVLVDAGIVMTENVIRHCERAEEEKAARLSLEGVSVGKGGVRLTIQETLEVTRVAARQVGRPIFFAMGIIILAFVPVFALTGQEGKLFHPLAFTKTFGMVGSTILAVTLVPVLCVALVRGPFHREDQNWLMRFLLAIYDPVLNWALRWRKTVLLLATILLVMAVVVAVGVPATVLKAVSQRAPRLAAHLPQGFGRQFMPPLDEGSLLFMPVLLPQTSISEVKRILSWQDMVLKATPEVASVGGKLGRAESATDPAPVEMIETTIVLKPEWISTNRTVLGFVKWPTVVRNPAWRPNMTIQTLRQELMDKMTQVPGYVPGFLQPIENRILMLSTGIRAQVGVKLMGDNLEVLNRKAIEIARIVESVPGAMGVSPSRTLGKPYLEIQVDRVAAARFGLGAAQILEAIEVGVGGTIVSTAIDGRQRIPIQVRLHRSAREDIEKLGELLVRSPGGTVVPLGQVATIRRTLGPSEINSENGRLRTFVQANVQGRDLGSFVAEIKSRMDRDVVPHLPPGVTIEYSGDYENLLRAGRTLLLIVPAVLLIIFLLLYGIYRSATEAAHVILAVPFALTGGVFLQAFLGYDFSVAVWVGYIALFGTAIQTGVVMVVYLEETLEKRRRDCLDAGREFTSLDLIQAVKDGARLRLRPKVMTVATVVASLLPLFWSHRTGSEVMKPLATPVVGGMVSSLVHILIVTPVIFAWLRERELRREKLPTRGSLVIST